MMAVVVMTAITAVVRIIRMVRVVRVMRMMRVIIVVIVMRIIRMMTVPAPICVITAPVIAWVCPVIWSVAVVRIPVRIPTIVIIWPAVTEAYAGSELDGDVSRGRHLLDDVNGIDNAFDAVRDGVFFVIFTRFTLHGVGIEISVI